MNRGNLFTDATPPARGERLETLLQHRNLVVERIVSSTDVIPTQYVQSQDEWVVLLRGDAQLSVAGERVDLKSGDYVFLPAGVAHTVEHAAAGALWLAIHLHPPTSAG